MASLSGVSSSNTMSSLMNSANTISGLASGLDTESMIENLVKGYQTKINQLNQKITKVEWKQDAYRSIIQKMVSLTNKYTSYTSGSNLTSPSFFNSAVKVETLGKYKDFVTASGKSSSDISLDAVHQLAKAAQYRVSAKDHMNAGDGISIEAGEGIDLNGQTELGSLKGSLVLTYGSKTVSVQFDEVADVEAMNDIRKKLAEEQGVDVDKVDGTKVLAGLIQQKLGNEKISFTGGTSDTADNRIDVKVNKDGSISFSDKSTAGNSVYISQASDSIKKAFGLDLENAEEDKLSVLKPVNYDFEPTKMVENAEYLSGKSMNLKLDDVTKSIKLPQITGSKASGYKIIDNDGNKLDYTAENYTKVLNDTINKAFKGKVEVTNADATGDSLQLRFEVKNKGSDLVINTDVGESLGIGKSSTTYLSTNKTLGDLLGEDKLKNLKQAYERDEKGNYKLDHNGNRILAKDDKGDPMYDFEINGTVVGSFSKNSKLSEVLSAINSSSEAGVQVSYSQTTKNFLFSSKETGAQSEIKISGGLAEVMFGSTEPSDKQGSSSFAEAYGMDWLKEGESAKLTFGIPGVDEVEVDVKKGDSIENVVNKLNESPLNMSHTFAYNQYTGQIEAKDKKTGAQAEFKITDEFDDEVKFDESKAPAVSYTPGQNAKFTVTVNGEQLEMERSTNSANIDGLTINMKKEFDSSYKLDSNGEVMKDENGNPIRNMKDGKPVYDAENSVTFKSTTDSDKIVDAVKSLLEDYNTMMAEIKSAYSTLPYQTSSGSFGNYEPLTDEEREGMSESAIERYEEKAKQGILFGDRTLSTLYDKMRNVFSPAGETGGLLRAMGITTNFSINDGTQAVTLDESKLRAMLESDPDKVAQVFTDSDGIMQEMKNTLESYSRTTGEPKGILIQQAGSPLSSLSLLNNSWQKEIDGLNDQITRWQDKLSNQVDRYTQQFTRLEMLINQMNSQSSSLAGLMGGG